MPILELKSLDKLPKKKPFKFLSGVFRRGGSVERELEVTEDMLYGTEGYPGYEAELSPRAATPGTAAGHSDIHEEMENLHLSRRDNPYLSSCEALDSVDDADCSLSPDLSSPRQASLSPPDSSDSALSPPSYTNILELHSHLVRSPPPIHWPTKLEGEASQDSRALSPESGLGSDCDQRQEAATSTSRQPRSHSVERMVSPGPGPLLLSPVRGQTPAVSPARGGCHTPGPAPDTSAAPAPVSAPVMMSQECRAYTRSISQSSTRLRCKTPDEDFSPTRFNIYALHQRSGLSRSSKSKSSYLVTSPGPAGGRECVYSYQPASRRSLAQLSSGGSKQRKSSMDTFTSWLPRRKRTRSQTRPDAKSMENLQSPTQCYGSIRGYRDKPSFTSHKSMSCMAEDAGLMSSEADTLVTSPTSHRKSLHNIKKSFSLKQKKSFHGGGGGGLYVDIDSQGNI